MDSLFFVGAIPVQGCPLLTVETPAVMVEQTRNSAIIFCNVTGERSYMVCDDTEWLGRPGNCSVTGMLQNWTHAERAGSGGCG